jgi:hypothetical protein
VIRNTATAAQLETLPGSAKTAARIINAKAAGSEDRGTDERPWHRRKSVLKLKSQICVSAELIRPSSQAVSDEEQGGAR